MNPIDLVRKKYVKRQNLDKLVGEMSDKIQFFREFTRSQAEYFQDLWVLKELEFMNGGFFVEFGATNGVEASNTFLLEKEFGWHGILVEPNVVYHEALDRNRNCIIDKRLVWDVSGEEIDFLSMDESYISVAKEDLRLLEVDVARRSRVDVVKSISLDDLLHDYASPEVIDFLSIDVEGSEFRILKSFFERNNFKVRLFVIEHNWRDDAHKLKGLLEEQGYELVHENLSHRDFWFRLRR